MKRETNNPNGILYKNKIQNNYKNMFTSKIDEIESLINNENLEEKQKTLEIQKKNAYYKLEKLDKELENIQYYENNENEELEEIDLNEEEILKNKINDIRQKNMKIQEQIKMIKDYYNNFLLKYKNKQIEDKKELKEECNKINADIQINKCFTKMTSEEKIILDKEEEIQKLDGELEKVLKKLEKIRSNKYISDIRLKELKNIIKKNNKNINKKQEKKKKRNYKKK
jgi:chromosome segregation ATPase